MAKAKKRPVVHLNGRAKPKASAPVRIEVRINDPKYEVELLKEDIQFKRVWFEPPADKEGWVKLMYSADGPTGDPWQIGKIKVYLDAEVLDRNFGDLAELNIGEPDKE
jgi:hypothetical protein